MHWLLRAAYRNHKLTMLMSDALDGDAKTLMFANISPAESIMDETHNFLSYATRVRSIVNDGKRWTKPMVLMESLFALALDLY